MTANVKCPIEQSSQPSTKHKLPIGWHWFTTALAVQGYNLSSKLPTPTHQLHYIKSRTSLSENIMSYRKTSVLLKLSNVTLAEIFTSTTKIQCGLTHSMI